MAMLLSLSSFENFYGRVLNLTWRQYVEDYRNDFSFSYAVALAAVGIDVVLYLPAWEPRGLHSIAQHVSVRFLPLAPWFKLWDRWPTLSRTPVGRYIAQYANTLAFENPLRAALVEDRIDVLYVQEYWTGRFDRLVCSLSTPIIGSDHGGRRVNQLTFRKRKTLGAAHAITCQTIDEVEHVRAFGTEPMLLPNGVDERYYSPDPSAIRTQTVVTVARLTDGQKRVSDLIRAMQYLPEPWRLEIAGTGPDQEKLIALASELGVRARVEFLGFVVDRERLRALYRTCGVYAMASSYEGLPLAILEAMSCECAVVVTTIRAFDDVVVSEKSGYKVPVGHPEALATAIMRAWDDRVRLGTAARQRVVERFSLSTTANRLAELVSSW